MNVEINLLMVYATYLQCDLWFGTHILKVSSSNLCLSCRQNFQCHKDLFRVTNYIRSFQILAHFNKTRIFLQSIRPFILGEYRMKLHVFYYFYGI